MILENLKELACKHFNITKKQFSENSRKIETVYARIAVANVLHLKGYSVYEIAEIIGKTRPTVLHHLRTFEDRFRYDYDFRTMYNEFIKEVE